MTWYIVALKKYAIFNGRSRRTEFWIFGVVNLLVLIGLGIVAGLLLGGDNEREQEQGNQGAADHVLTLRQEAAFR